MRVVSCFPIVGTILIVAACAESSTSPSLPLRGAIARSNGSGNSISVSYRPTTAGLHCGALASVAFPPPTPQSRWIEVRVHAGNGSQVNWPSGVNLQVVNVSSQGSYPHTVVLDGLSIADSTNEYIEVKYRSNIAGITTTHASRTYYYHEQGQDLNASSDDCMVSTTWSPKATPAVAQVFITPRYDTLPVGGAGTYIAHAYASDGFTRIFTTGPASWSITHPSIASFLSTSSGTGPFGEPSANVWATTSGFTFVYATRSGVVGGSELHVGASGGGGCPPAGC